MLSVKVLPDFFNFSFFKYVVLFIAQLDQVTCYCATYLEIICFFLLAGKQFLYSTHSCLQNFHMFSSDICALCFKTGMLLHKE